MMLRMRAACRLSSTLMNTPLKHTHTHYTRLLSTALDHDVLICGGGVVGAALAADLLIQSKGTISIGIVELNPPSEVRTDGFHPDLRVYALSPSSIARLKSIDAWRFVAPRSQPYTTMQVWESDGPGVVRFNSQDMGAPELGRICEDSTIQGGVYEAIKQSGYQGSLTTYYGSAVTDIAVADRSATVTLKGGAVGRQLTSRLVVGADGANSTVRKLAGIPTWGWGYGQEAVVATVKIHNAPASAPAPVTSAIPTADAAGARISAASNTTPNPTTSASTSTSTDSTFTGSNHTAWQKYLSTGPLALLPLWEGHASIVWSTSVSEAKRLKALPKDAFISELNSALQSPPRTDKWAVLEEADGTSLPPVLNNMMGLVGALGKRIKGGGRGKGGGGAGGMGVGGEDVGAGVRRNPLQRAKREMAALADVLMAAAQMVDPLQSPPHIVSLAQESGPDRVSFPLALSQAQTYCAPRVVLVGDAAHSIHPQAGQGLNLGIADAFSLSAELLRALEAGGDVGEARVLRAYEGDRKVKNLGMLGIVDGINNLFSNGRGAWQGEGMGQGQGQRQSPHVSSLAPSTKGRQFLRSFGMLGVHSLGAIKHRIAKFAMGL